MTDIYKKLEQLGLELPPAPEAVGMYTPALLSGEFLFLSGNGGADPRKLPAYGRVGEEVTIEEAAGCARSAALALLSAAEAALGDLGRVSQLVKLNGYVNSGADFHDHPKVLDGASDLFFELFGPELGRHARTAVGVSSLPFNIPVEIELILRVKEADSGLSEE